MENLVKRNVKLYKEDFELDKEKILKNGIGTYYFITRECGTVLITDIEMIANQHAKEVWNYYKDNDKTSRLYEVTVEEVNGTEVIGTVKNLRKQNLKKVA